MKTSNVYVIDALRTPVGKAPRGLLSGQRPDDLLAQCLRGLMAGHQEIDPAMVGDVVVGCAMPEGEQGLNVARMALLLAGLPDSVPGMTVNRFCASGLEAIAIAAERVRSGAQDLAIAAGVESMSRVPMMGFQPAFNPRTFDGSVDIAIAYGMGLTAEAVAVDWGVSREDQDAYALQSHQRALQAMQDGCFKDEILPLELQQARAVSGGAVALDSRIVDNDEGPRADSSEQALAALRPVFSAEGSVTAGNSSQMSDGAAALLLASEALVDRLGLRPMARFHGYHVAGVTPKHMGIGPVAAVPPLLERHGLTVDQLDHIELNEAFAAQTLAVMRDLGFDSKQVNPQGGAIALGHPLGATGAIRSTTLVHALRRERLRYGLVTMCIGTGMGAAGLFEAVA